MTGHPHQLTIDSDNVYTCACGVSGTWAEVRPHLPATESLARAMDGEQTFADPPPGFVHGGGSTHADPAERLRTVDLATYDEDAEQDKLHGRPHWGSTIPSWPPDDSIQGDDFAPPTLVPFLAAREPEPTCQTCGHLRRDHQMRGHPFVVWFA